MRTAFITIGMVVLAAASAKAQSELGDPGEGLTIARTLCVECHRIEKAESSRKLSPVKAFQEIADNPARTELSLRVFLRTPHRHMPNLALTQAQTDNVIAYILSLKRPMR